MLGCRAWTTRGACPGDSAACPGDSAVCPDIVVCPENSVCPGGSTGAVIVGATGVITGIIKVVGSVGS